ncbi:MAG TPA: NIPSNAP family protein [Sphingobacteriaceae bacterium]|nr:NIPSNAP family protein [Sphingobacteriaceae bacterium]
MIKIIFIDNNNPTCIYLSPYLNFKKFAAMILKRLLILPFLFTLLCISIVSYSKSKEELYEIRIYHLKNKEQENRIDAYLKDAFLPVMKRNGIHKVGVFKPIGNDTAKTRLIYLLIPYKSEKQYFNLSAQLNKDKQFMLDGQEYHNAAYNNIPYNRIESILLKAFYNTFLQQPVLKNDLVKRIYELRSYEGPTEKLFRNKVHMFNEGQETEIFRRLGFNPVFYGEVLAGSRTPNLMYMTSFEDMVSRDAHWKEFRIDPFWKKLSAMPFYKNNVSKSSIIFLQPTSYSGI